MSTKPDECQECQYQDMNPEYCDDRRVKLRLKLIGEIENAIGRKHARYGWKNTGNADQDVAG